ncbi:MAG: hypothetical protein WD738_22275 [Pirellulales bacterium]
MSTFNRFSLVLIYVGLVYATDAAYAMILVEEQFSHADGNLVGQSPMPGPGNLWVAHENEGRIPIQVIGGMAVLRQGSGSGGREDVNIEFPGQPGTATTYAGFDFELPSSEIGDIVNLDAEGSNFVHFKSNLLTTHFRARTGVLAPAGDGDFRLAINANGGQLDEGVAWATELNFDTMHRVVVSCSAATGESKLWLNPLDELSANIAHTGHSTGQRLESFALRQSSDYFGIQLIDNLVVATTFAEALAGTSNLGVTGDFNSDSTVDAAEFVLWRKNDGPQAGYDAWRANFGVGAGGSSFVSAAVPEPSALLLWILSSAGLRLRRVKSFFRE